MRPIATLALLLFASCAPPPEVGRHEAPPTTETAVPQFNGGGNVDCLYDNITPYRQAWLGPLPGTTTWWKVTVPLMYHLSDGTCMNGTYACGWYFTPSLYYQVYANGANTGAPSSPACWDLTPPQWAWAYDQDPHGYNYRQVQNFCMVDNGNQYAHLWIHDWNTTAAYFDGQSAGEECWVWYADNPAWFHDDCIWYYLDNCPQF